MAYSQHLPGRALTGLDFLKALGQSAPTPETPGKRRLLPSAYRYRRRLRAASQIPTPETRGFPTFARLRVCNIYITPQTCRRAAGANGAGAPHRPLPSSRLVAWGQEWDGKDVLARPCEARRRAVSRTFRLDKRIAYPLVVVKRRETQGVDHPMLQRVARSKALDG